MTLDQRGRQAGADLRERLDEVMVPPAGNTVRRVQRTRRRTRGALVAVVALGVAGLVVTNRASSPTQVSTASRGPDALPAGTATDAGWQSIPKESAGLGASASIEVLTSTGNSLLVASVSNHPDARATVWRSTDGLHWAESIHPSQAGYVTAIGNVGATLLAFGTTPVGPDQTLFAWSSTDDGATWTEAALDAQTFGAPAPEMGRPFIDGLRWNDSTGEWIASGGASDGYAGIWTSSDGTHWTSRLAPDNSAGGVTIIDDGNGGLLGYWSRLAWSSQDGRTWTPVDLDIPSEYYLKSVANGVAIAARLDGSHATPTPLLRSNDGLRKWSEDTTFLDQFPDAVGETITANGEAMFIVGFAGDHTDAWVSTDAATWQALPASLKEHPGGVLYLTASLGSTTVIMGTAPELDRYFVVDT